MRRTVSSSEVVSKVSAELESASGTRYVEAADELRYNCGLFNAKFVADIEVFGLVELDFNEILSLTLSYGETLLKLPSYYVYIDSMVSYVKKDIDTKKIELNNLDDSIRTKFVEDSTAKGSKVTEGAISSAINSNPLHISAEKTLVDLENKQRVLSGLLRGIDKFNTNLIELSRKTRRGLDTEE